MKKGIIIIGEKGSGKTTKAKELSSEYLPEEVCTIKYSVSPFLLQKVTEKTKCLIFDDLKYCTSIAAFFGFIDNEIWINRKCGMPFKHKFERVILVFDSKFKIDPPASITRRFEIIEVN